MKPQRFATISRKRHNRSALSLLTIILVSTLISLLLPIFSNQSALAVANGDLSVKENQDIRILRYFKDCLQTRLDVDGNGNYKYESWWEVFKNSSDGKEKKDGKDVIAVGVDLSPKNGVMTCEAIAQKAVGIYQPSRSADYDQYLMKEIWGKTLTNGPIEVDPDAIRTNANNIITRRINDAIARREAAGSSRQATLLRFAPLLDQCFDNWSKKPFKDYVKYPDDAIKYTDREVFAERRTFDWDEIKKVPGFREVYSDFFKVSKDAFLGDIMLDFQTLRPARNKDFDDRNTDWFPIGNDLGSGVLGPSYYKNHDNQTFLDCNWVKAHGDFLFSRDKQFKYYYGVDGDSFKMFDQNKSVVNIDLGTKTADGNNGSTNYQCIVAPPLSWIACPIVTLVVGAIDFLEGAIIEALQVPPLTTDGAFNDLHTAWAAFRDMANALLVIIFLITIFAQILPIEVDPYMIKKVLPKLIAAAIFIQFSYFFVQIMFDISRVLAQGVQTILDSIPVNNVNGGVFGQSAGNATATSALGLLGGIAVGTAGAAAAFTAGTALIVPVLLLLLAGLISIVTLFITLQMRMIIIIIMTIIAPLAFLAWILPNTENYFKKWLSGLIKLLLMYPIIVFMVSSTTLISSISYQALAAMSGGNKGAAGGASDITKIMISLIPIVVYMMIPMTFKWAGGVFATIAGAVQNQGTKWSKQSRSGALMKNSLQDAKNKAGTKLMDTHGQKGFGRLGARVASGNAFSFGDAGNRKLKASQETAMHAVEESIQDTHRGKSNKDLLLELDQRKKEGKIAEAAAIGNLIMAQGGGLEMTKYFQGLEYDMVQSEDAAGKPEFTTDSDGNRVPKMVAKKKDKSVVRRDETGAVRAVDDEIWNHVAKKNGAALAVAAPHSIGKPISQASPQALISAKGEAPAREFEAEVRQLHQNLSSADTETADNAKKQLRQIASRFIQTAQQDNAGEMQPAMVDAWKKVSSILDTTGVTVDRLDPLTGERAPQGIQDFIKDRTKNDTLEKFVQGT